ncbi:hypothetical protein [Algoriphagus marinus]|uniref:hypothetical protein n=1 Tax=Algoriphagus marinus TaxID=1925762 RepID=UPI00094BAF11|nr:hypothetical protein [Algoriphagus marinus]
MEFKVSKEAKFEIPDEILKEFHNSRFCEDFQPNSDRCAGIKENSSPTLFSVNLNKAIEWLHGNDIPKPLENEVCSIPVLLFVPNFSTDHLLFHYDGSLQSANLIRKFLETFADIIKNSKATIISPSFIPKSKQKEEQELINQVSQATAETSFIKFNFLRIGDFWSYAVKHDCSLLVTTKNYQADLAKVLFHFYKGAMWSDRLSFYLAL